MLNETQFARLNSNFALLRAQALTSARWRAGVGVGMRLGGGVRVGFGGGVGRWLVLLMLGGCWTVWFSSCGFFGGDGGGFEGAVAVRLGFIFWYVGKGLRDQRQAVGFG